MGSKGAGVTIWPELVKKLSELKPNETFSIILYSKDLNVASCTIYRFIKVLKNIGFVEKEGPGLYKVTRKIKPDLKW